MIYHSSEEGKREIYFMALIDILTKYGMKKRTAQAAKTVKHGAGAEISTVHPDQYAKRFMDFITKCIEWYTHQTCALEHFLTLDYLKAFMLFTPGHFSVDIFIRLLGSSWFDWRAPLLNWIPPLLKSFFLCCVLS